MWGDQFAQDIIGNYASEGNLMCAQALFASGLSQSLTQIKEGWTGTAGTVITSGQDGNQIKWQNDTNNDSNQIPVPDPIEYSNYFILAVINYIAGAEGKLSGDTLQQFEAARSTWSNLLNASSSSSDLQTSPVNGMLQSVQGDLNNTQSAMQSLGSLSSVAGTLCGLAGTLNVGG